MNTRPALANADRPTALSVSFNQDASCFAVGFDQGFHIYGTDPCELHVTRDLAGGISSASMLSRSNFLALLGGGRTPKYPPNKTIIFDDAIHRGIISLEFNSTILAVRLNRTRIVVVTLHTIYVYAFSRPPTRLHEFETAANPFGLVALQGSFLVFPGRSEGQLQMVDVGTGNVSIIPAHTSSLAAVAVSGDGGLVATASEKGTIIRLWAAQNGALLTELRRGIDHARIYSLAISPGSKRLAVCSDKNTVHVYNLPGKHSAQGDNRRWNLLGKLPLLPKYFKSEWSAAHAEFTGSGEAALGWVGEESVVVVTTGGKGGEARWEKFVLVEQEVAGEMCVELMREGWRRYLDNE